ncbi:MAG TPA: dTDP-glucose 4,6-dehydratase [Burkholderiales bacterium]|nr:dTDP-glucose 4,6-dehydratase [Burkholderiales bacterium]
MQPTILVTGGAGFIGSNFVRAWMAAETDTVVNLDKLTYAGNRASLADLDGDPRHVFVHGDIADATLVAQLLGQHRPRAIVHFAAESHVDRSISGPAPFVQTNVVGTFTLLEAAREYWSRAPSGERDAFRFLHVSTDEVYGSLAPDDRPFTERSRYAPNSPYAASKAGADHLVRSYRHTYGLPTLIGNCSNNYGPYQFPEKLIPLTIFNALRGGRIPVYGDGAQVRDWLHVSDHCAALRTMLAHAAPGATYNIGGNAERANLEVVRALCALVDAMRPEGAPRSRLIEHVADRPGHDRRYAIDGSAIARDLGWRPRVAFDEGLRATIEWYLANGAWVDSVTSGEYRRWIDVQYCVSRRA